MRVIAKAMGFYGGIRRREGQVFEVPEGTKGSWFEPVGGQPAKAKPRKEVPASPDTLSAMNASGSTAVI